MIPKIIHQIWIQGVDSMPEHLKQHHNNCRIINDEFKHVAWDDQKIRKFLEKKYGDEYLKLYDSYARPAQKADLARYCILHTYGGIYLDMDMVCRKSLLSFLGYKLFFTTDLHHTWYRRYLTGIIGAVKKHPVFEIILRNIVARQEFAGENVTYSTGTKLFYDSVEEYRNSTDDKDIHIIDRKFLHPCDILNDNEECAYTCQDCYVAHTNNSSWSPFLRGAKYVVKNYLLFLILALAVIIILIYFIVRNRR
jgi:inositol phosphorylceramide mannosyltransferase catalytic subunit